MGSKKQAKTTDSLYTSIIPTTEPEKSQGMSTFKGLVVNRVVIAYMTVKHLQDL